MSYLIYFSSQADKDMVELEAYIRDRLKSPLTASRYMEGLDNVILKLSTYAGSIGANEYVQELFGSDARHINFKKMAIVFYTESDIIYIMRIIPSSLIY